jgi:hypothetical protein
MEKIYQQGDVLLKQRKRFPANAKKLKPKARGWVVAEGEATGHAHVLDVPDVEMREDANGIIWVKVNAPSEIRHEEHDAQVIAPGVYEVGIVREVDPFTEEIREVMD